MIENLELQKKGKPSLLLEMGLDENGLLSAEVTDMKSGAKSKVAVSLAEQNPVEHPPVEDDSEDEEATGVALGLSSAALAGAAVAGAAVAGAAVAAKKKGKKGKKSEKTMEDFSEENSKMHLDEYNDMDSLLVDTGDGDVSKKTSSSSLDDSILSDSASSSESSDISFDEPVLEDSPFDEGKDASFDEPVPDMPSFDDENSSTDLSGDLSLDDMNFDDTENTESENNLKVGNDMDDFNFPEENEDSKLDTNFDDTDFSSFEDDKQEEKTNYSSPLYDEDTFDETSKDKKKKVLIPVLICGIVAVLAIVALLIFLFIIKPKKANKEYKPVYTPTETVKEAKSDEAREDEIIIVETPEVAPANTVSKASSSGEVIDYKIKWGDTLWDISKTYYKTPWQYQFLADYNDIKNPDFILAGAHLAIPAK